jgi:hypothetical protein
MGAWGSRGNPTIAFARRSEEHRRVGPFDEACENTIPVRFDSEVVKGGALVKQVKIWFHDTKQHSFVRDGYIVTNESN